MNAKPFRFMHEVKAEMKKVVWPDFKSTRQLTLMVFIMVAFVAIYLLVVDQVLHVAVQYIIETASRW